MKYKLLSKDRGEKSWHISGYHYHNDVGYFTSLNKAFRVKEKREKHYPSAKFKVGPIKG